MGRDMNSAMPGADIMSPEVIAPSRIVPLAGSRTVRGPASPATHDGKRATRGKLGAVAWLGKPVPGGTQARLIRFTQLVAATIAAAELPAWRCGRLARSG
jgi:hypothetical protein